MTGLGRYVRLKSAIAAELDQVGDSAFAAKALWDAYGTFRSESLAVAEETGTVDEFNRLFPLPQHSARRPAVRGGFDPVEASASAREARALLSRLGGWLNGFILDEHGGSGAPS